MSLPESLPRVEVAESLPDAMAAWAAAAAEVDAEVADWGATLADPVVGMLWADILRSHARAIGDAQPARAAADWMDAARLARRDVTPDRREAAGHARRRDALAADAVTGWNTAATAAAQHLAELHELADKHGRTTQQPATPARRPMPSFH